MEHRAIISKGVGCPINQKTAARSITRSFIRWQNLAQIWFWRDGLRIRFANSALFPRTLFTRPLSSRRLFEPQYRMVFAARERKESNSTTEPHINHLLETEPGWNNAWFSDCKSNYENPVNPTQVRPATGGGESKSEAVGFRSVRVFLWRFNSLPLGSVLSAVWTKCQFIFKLC